MRGKVFSGPEVQPAEVPTRVAPAGVPAGRVPAAKVTASGVAASASVLCLCGDKKTDYGQQHRKDARRPHKEGSSSGHYPSTPASIAPVYSCSGSRQCVTFRSKDVRLLEETLGAGLDRLPVETIDNASGMVQFQAPQCVRNPSQSRVRKKRCAADLPCCKPKQRMTNSAQMFFCGRISATGMVRSTPSGLVLPEVGLRG
jgi:hypothetical protein